MYYRGAAAAIVVYDITNMVISFCILELFIEMIVEKKTYDFVWLQVSFQRAKKWIEELQRQGNPHLVTVLVANKTDLSAKREVEIEVYISVLHCSK